MLHGPAGVAGPRNKEREKEKEQCELSVSFWWLLSPSAPSKFPPASSTTSMPPAKASFGRVLQCCGRNGHENNKSDSLHDFDIGSVHDGTISHGTLSFGDRERERAIRALVLAVLQSMHAA